MLITSRKHGSYKIQHIAQAEKVKAKIVGKNLVFFGETAERVFRVQISLKELKKALRDVRRP